MLAQMMYNNLGYTIYRQVLGYYSGENTEDAYGTFVAPLAVSFILLIALFCPLPRYLSIY